MTAPNGFITDTDRSTVWVHNQDRLIARFGKNAYEVMSPEAPNQIADFARVESVQSWLDFKAKVASAHGFEIVEGLTPLRFHNELGLSFGYAPEDAIFEVPLSAPLGSSTRSGRTSGVAAGSRSKVSNAASNSANSSCILRPTP